MRAIDLKPWMVGVFLLVIVAAVGWAQDRGPGNRRGGPPMGGPGNDQTFGAISEDGFHFTVLPGPFFEHASVPTVVEVTKDSPAGHTGTLLLYFVDFSGAARSPAETISMATSRDGRQWSAKRSIVIEGKANRGGTVDPSATELPDGRIRLFFLGPDAVGMDPAREAGDHKIYSAVSEDGVNFRVEDGVRFQAPGITDPDAVRVGGEWFLFLSRGRETLLARSKDGTTFTQDSAFNFQMGGVPGAVALADGRIRVLATTRPGIVSALYTPGAAIVPEEGERILRGDAQMVADPSCIRRLDGSYYMVFKKRPGGRF